MYSSSLRQAAATVALATAATLVPIGVGVVTADASSAAPAHRPSLHAHQDQRFRTQLTAAATDPADPDNAAGKVLVSGRLTARDIGLAGRQVRLLVKHDGAARWTLGRVERTQRSGRVEFRVGPTVATSYRLVFVGTRRLQPTKSPAVSVAARDTRISIAATPGRVAMGDPAVISGVVTDEDAALPGVLVELRGRKAGTRKDFALVGTSTTSDDGSVSFTVTPARSTAYVLVVGATETSQAARSKVAVVGIKADSRIVVRTRTLGGKTSIVGVLRSGGDGLAGRKVTLQEQAAGATEWTDVRSNRTARDGYVDFRRAAVEGTSYRLSYAGTDRIAPSTSRTVVA